MFGIYCRNSKNRQDEYCINNQRDAGIQCANKEGIGHKKGINFCKNLF